MFVAHFENCSLRGLEFIHKLPLILKEYFLKNDKLYTITAVSLQYKNPVQHFIVAGHWEINKQLCAHVCEILTYIPVKHSYTDM